MSITDKMISKGFIIAGLMNLSVLIFSKFFTNSVIAKFAPIVMSNFGLLMIIIWGVAYISINKNYYQVKWLVLVFAMEKLVYVYTWIYWLLNNQLSNVYSQDVIAGAFYSIYGVNDSLFFIFFSFVFIRLIKK